MFINSSYCNLSLFLKSLKANNFFFKIIFLFVCVKVLPSIIPFTFGEEEFKIDESVTGTCSVTKGDMPISIWWTLSDSYESTSEYNISSNDGVMISKAGNKLSVLNIEAVKARHRGNYTCYAKNKAGVTQHSAYLAINS
jgi:hypothetical protein